MSAVVARAGRALDVGLSVPALFGLLAAAALMSVPVPAVAADFFFAVDVPQTLTGATPLPPNWLLSRSAGGYGTSGAVLPAGVEPLALHRRPDGAWLVTPTVPVDLPGAPVGPRDVAMTTDGGATFSPFFDGGVAGIPDGVRIDALFLDPTGAPVLSFDVPVTLGGVLYSQSDLVRFGGRAGFSLYWSAESPNPVPAYANVVGADLDPTGAIVITLDVPTLLGTTEFLPGELIAWTGSGFAPYALDPSWPPDVQMRDFSLAHPAGAVPDGGGVAGVPLMVDQAPGGQITLTWDAACAGGAADYDIYEGRLGAGYTHIGIQCGTGGVTHFTFTPGPGNTYYLVVPQNGLTEGSYGVSSAGAERPPAVFNACKPQQIGSCG